ncbi:MAG: hypothetical protein AB7F86_15690 [Bdellovibrionales bacterium]
MQKNYPWATALQIKPDQLDSWSADAPPDWPLLVFCLLEGHIEPEAYLNWARDYYELPVLNRDYFVESFDLEAGKLWIQGQESHWRSWNFPVEKWEDVTIIGCVEPPQDEETNQRHVLCDPTMLRAVWNRMFSPSEEEAKPEESVIGAADSAVIPEIPGMPNDEPPPAPEATSTNFKFTLNIDENNLFKMGSETATPASTPAIPAEPEPVAKPAEAVSAKKTSAPPIPIIEESVSTILDISEKTMVTAVDASPVPAIEVREEKIELPDFSSPPPAPAAATKAKPSVSPPKIHTIESEPIIIKPKPAAKEAPAAAAASVSTSTSNANKKANLSAQEVKELFAEIKKLYKNALLMKCVGEKAVLSNWDDDCKPANKSVSIELAFPTFLRIIAKTKLPYHGYLVDSPAHREFFSSLGMSELPTCVTAIPLVSDSKLFGVLVAIGDETNQDLETLKTIEALAEKLNADLSPSWAKAA